MFVILIGTHSTHTHIPLFVEEWRTISVEHGMLDSVNFGIALVAWKRRRSQTQHTSESFCVTLIRYKLISTNILNSRNLGLKFSGESTFIYVAMHSFKLFNFHIFISYLATTPVIKYALCCCST